MRAVLLAALLLVPGASAQIYSDAVKQLAARILDAIPARSTIAFSIESRASIQSGEVDEMRGSMEALLRAGGVELGDSETKVKVTISEDPARYLLIAPLGKQVIIVSWKKPPAAPVEYRIAIKRAPVLEQHDPILDVKLSSDGEGMQVLETERTVDYNRLEGHWQVVRSTPAPSPAASRDPRGSFALAGYRMVRGRNYFDGGDRGTFYTMADTGAGTLFANVDGQARLYGERPEAMLAIRNWGSDLAAIASNCGSKKQVLATAPTTNDDAADHVQAFEFSSGGYLPVTEPLPLSGPVTALWTAETGEQVTLVVHNRQTGMYEASRLSLSCAQ